MRKYTLSALAVFILVLGLMSPALAEDHGLPSEQDVLDQDSVTIDVALVCDDVPDEVDIVDDPWAGEGNQNFYRINWDFDTPPDPNLIVWEEAHRTLDMTDDVGADGHLYLWNPEGDSPARAHDPLVEVTYYLVSGNIASVVAEFDDNGCLTDVNWDKAEADVDVSVHLAHDTEKKHASLNLGDSIPVTVDTVSDADGQAFPNKWQLALEVTGDVTEDTDIDLVWHPDENTTVELDFTYYDGHLYVYGEVEAALLTNETDSQDFTATFHDGGSFTGTVYALNTGELHPDIYDSYFPENG